jgi:hypothetical protein
VPDVETDEDMKGVDPKELTEEAECVHDPAKIKKK